MSSSRPFAEMETPGNASLALSLARLWMLSFFSAFEALSLVFAGVEEVKSVHTIKVWRLTAVERIFGM